MKRAFLLAISLLTPLQALPLQAQAPQGQVLNLQDADIRAFIQDVARATGNTFIIDPRVTGKVTITSQQPLQPGELMDVLFSALRANGLVAVSTSAGAYRIAPEEGAAQSAATGTRTGEGFSTQVVRLSSLDARAAAETLKPLIGRQGVVVPSTRGNLLIIADYADNLRRIRGLLGEIDRNGGVTETVTLRASAAREMAGIVDSLLKAPGADAQARNGLVSIVVVESSNTLILRGEAEAVRPLLPIIEDLDRRAEGAGDVRVVRLQFADAQQLVPVLQQLVGQSTQAVQSTASPQAPLSRPPMGRGGNAEPSPQDNAPAPATAPREGQRASITRYPGTNAIVIAAPPETQTMLAEVIRKLDVRREQVLVEAIVVEVSDATAKRLGVQFAIAGRNGSGAPLIATNYGNARPNLPAILGAAVGPQVLPEGSTLQSLRDAAAASILGATGMIGGGIGNINGDTLFGFVINAVKSDNDSNLLSTPSILTLDNQDATIMVGQNVPITTGEVLGTANINPFRTIQRQDVGIQLDVRPQINAGGTVTLFLRQEVSSVAGPVSTASAELVLNRRQVETTVNVDDGEIIVLGGLLDQNERLTNERTPVLGDVPVLGNLFRSTSRERQRTNLMIFIRPTILKSGEDARRATAPKYEYVVGQQRTADPSRQSQLEALVQQYLRATPPRMPAVPAQPATP